MRTEEVTRKGVLVLSAIGMLGGGIPEKSFEAAIRKKPDVIGADCGSIDSGPYSLGSGKPNKPRAALKSDLRILLNGGVKAHIPVLVGSAGTAGGNSNVSAIVDIVKEIAEEDRLNFKMAIIHAELSQEKLLKYMDNGKIKELYPAPPLDRQVVETLEHTVAMMGPEPFVKALTQNADVVIAGRSSDCSIFAAMPILKGFDFGPSWHAAKLLECGSLCAAKKPSNPECMMAYIDDTGFTIEAANPDVSVTPLSCAMNALHENDNPIELTEPGRILDIKEAMYVAEDERSVRVSGSRIRRTPYTVRLEGARFYGYRSLIFGAIEDPLVISQVDYWLERVKQTIAKKVNKVLGYVLNKEYEVVFRTYGKGLLADEEYVPREMCVLITILADTQEKAMAIGELASHAALHCPIPQWDGAQSNLAFPMSPNCFPAGPAYGFCLNHVLELEDPLEPFPIEYLQV